jgi:hypothetical protein
MRTLIAQLEVALLGLLRIVHNSIIERDLSFASELRFFLVHQLLLIIHLELLLFVK